MTTDMNEIVQNSLLWQNTWQEQRDASNIEGGLDALNRRVRFLEETLFALTGVDLSQPTALAAAMQKANSELDADLHPPPPPPAPPREPINWAVIIASVGAVFIVLAAILLVLSLVH